MTELEQQLLSAFEQLQSEQAKQQEIFAVTCSKLTRMFMDTEKFNMELIENVIHLDRLVQQLSAQVTTLSTQVISLEERL